MRWTPAWLTPPSLVLLVIGTRWPFRSRALFDWDSANFALAIVRTDIAAHRPHPPGYIGYGRVCPPPTHRRSIGLAVVILAAAVVSLLLRSGS